MTSRKRSDLSGFYRDTVRQRRSRLEHAAGITERTVERLVEPMGAETADQMVENAVGVFGLPLGICVNLEVNGHPRLAPMAIEEPSVVAAASYAAKLLAAGGGIQATSSEPLMIGQIQLLDVPCAEDARTRIQQSSLELLTHANAGHPRLTEAGGGARSIEVRDLPPLDPSDPLGAMLVVHLVVDVRDAMGANAINAMCEAVAPQLEKLSRGRARLRILSNLNDRRTVTVSGRVPHALLDGKGAQSGPELAAGIEEASVFAERDPYRAATHNKGIMNGIDAVLIATGQDWRAVEAGAHAYAARDGRYTALARWRTRDGNLYGEMTLPMAVGTVGGIVRTHPSVRAALELVGTDRAEKLGQVAAAVGLAQNLGALRALSAEGIQTGHMRLHARNVSSAAGAVGDEVPEVSRLIVERRAINVDAAREVLVELRARKAAP